VRLPNQTAHAVFHAIVENQLAQADPVTVPTLARLKAEGLTRHEAIHAIASVLAGHMHDLMASSRAAQPPPTTEAYYQGLRDLSADTWRQGSCDTASGTFPHAAAGWTRAAAVPSRARR